MTTAADEGASPSNAPWNVVTALKGTIAPALLVLALPVRRAVRFRPGEALRYA